MKEAQKVKDGLMAVIIPALNEEEGIGLTISEINEFLYKPRILVVDGKSKDKTVLIAKSLGADVIFQEGKGKGDAIACALKHIGPEIIYIVLIDADYTYPAEHIQKMLEVIESDSKIGMICGDRLSANHNFKGSFIFYIGNKVLAAMATLLNGLSLKDPLTGLRVLRANVLTDWTPASKAFDIEVELNHFIEQKGYKIVEVPIDYRSRLGEKKLKLSDGFLILKRMLSLSMNNKPVDKNY